jgi:hypothetical protein
MLMSARGAVAPGGYAAGQVPKDQGLGVSGAVGGTGGEPATL